MPPRLEHRDRRRRERRLGKSADRNGNDIWCGRKRVEDRRPAVRAEMKGSLLALVRDSHEVAEATGHLHSVRWEPRLDPEGAAGS